MPIHATLDETGKVPSAQLPSAVGGGAAWGEITGTLSSQTDLNAALSGKAASDHNHSGVYQPAATVLTNTTASFTTAQETKLSGIATGATSNSADATLLARENHTGTQAANTITGLATVATTGSYNDLTDKPASGSVSGVSAVLTATQANSTVTPEVLTNHSFTVGPGKTIMLNAQLIATSAATTTGVAFGVKVTHGAGANANAQGSCVSYVNLSSAATATGLLDGDRFDVAANASATFETLGTATVAGNNAAFLQCVIKNQSTNANTTVEVVFRSEVATSAVTAQIGTAAAGLIF